MVREIWRATGRGKKAPKALAAAVDLPPLTAADHEYLFLQLLEGVAHGWQQPRVMKFFTTLRHRVPKSQWLAWLEKFGEQLVESPNPSEDMARRLIQLSELDCGEVTSLAGDYGHRALGKIYGGYTEEFLPALEGSEVELGYLPDFGMGGMEFAALDLPEEDVNQEQELFFSEPLLSGSLTEAALELAHEPMDPLQENLVVPSSPEQIINSSTVPLETVDSTIPNLPVNLPPHSLGLRSTATPGWDEESSLPTFGEVPPELRLSNKSAAILPPPPPPPPNWGGNLAIEDTIEQIDDDFSIEEFGIMLRSNPERLQQIAGELGLETTDPQVVVDRVVAQMQQQIQNNPQP
jgi:hypothetical protein